MLGYSSKFLEHILTSFTSIGLKKHSYVISNHEFHNILPFCFLENGQSNHLPNEHFNPFEIKQNDVYVKRGKTTWLTKSYEINLKL